LWLVERALQGDDDEEKNDGSQKDHQKKRERAFWSIG